MKMNAKSKYRLYGFVSFLSFIGLLLAIGQFLIGIWLNAQFTEWAERLNHQPDVEAHWQSKRSGFLTRSGKLAVRFTDYLGISRQMQADIRYQWRLINADIDASVMLDHQPLSDLSASVHALSKSLTLQMNVYRWQDEHSRLVLKPAQLKIEGEMSKWMEFQLDGAGFQIPQQHAPMQLIQSAAYHVEGGGELTMNFQESPHFSLQTDQLTIDTTTTSWMLIQPILHLNINKISLSGDETLMIQPELSMTSLRWMDEDNRPMEVAQGRASVVFGGIHAQRLSELFKSLSDPQQSSTALMDAIDGVTSSPLALDKINIQGQLNRMPVDLSGVIHIQPFLFRQFVFLLYQKKALSLFTADGGLSVQSFDKQQLPTRGQAWYEQGTQVGWFVEKNGKLSTTLNCQRGQCEMNGVRLQ